MHQLVEEFEWLIAAELAHPNLAVPIATGTDGIVAYLARDFVAADSVDVVVRDEGPVAPPVAVRVAIELADALDLAAAVGVLHGALHPRDVLMSPNETRLTDIGVRQALVKLGVATPLHRPYSAPEQIAGEVWSRPADVFGLGMLVHELLWGKRPSAIGDEAAKALTPMPGADMEALRAVFARALAKDPARRFETAIAFAYGLRSAFSEVEVPSRQGDSRASSESHTGIADRRPRTSKAARLPLDEPEEGTAIARPSPHEIPLSPTGLLATSGLAINPVDHGSLELGLREADPPQYVEVDDVPAASARGKEPDRRGSPVVDAPLVKAAAGVHDRGGSVPRKEVAAGRSTVGLMSASLIVGVALGFGGGFAVGTWRQPAASSPVSPGAPASTEAVEAGDTVPLPASPTRGLGESKKPDAAGRAVGEKAVPNSSAAAVKPGGVALPSDTRTKERRGGASVAEAPKPGRLLVRSSPAGARVFVDGEQQGATPAAVRNLASGVHRVRVVLEGYVTEERRITINAAQPSQSVDVELERASSVARDRTTFTPTTAAADPLRGALIVESRPAGAAVYIDGKLRGTTPLVISNVDAGEHVMRLEREGYVRWSSSIRVVAGERNRLTASLER